MKRGLRMKDLEDLSGERKSTILYYIREGLLPQPEKATPNSALYDESYVGRIQKIRVLQQEFKLPIKEIKELISVGWEQVDEQIECKRTFLSDFTGSKQFNFLEMVKETGISPDNLNTLIDWELVLPIWEGQFNEEDKIMVQLFQDSAIQNFPLEKLRFYPKYFRKIAKEEMQYQKNVVKDLSHQDKKETSVALYKIIRQIKYYQGKRMLELLIKDFSESA